MQTPQASGFRPKRDWHQYYGAFSLDVVIKKGYYLSMTSGELKRWLAEQGCTFKKGKGGHQKVYLGDKKSILPMHGKGQELKTGTVEAIKKALGLKGKE